MKQAMLVAMCAFSTSGVAQSVGERWHDDLERATAIAGEKALPVLAVFR